jgi:hypothetical protein
MVRGVPVAGRRQIGRGLSVEIRNGGSNRRGRPPTAVADDGRSESAPTQAGPAPSGVENRRTATRACAAISAGAGRSTRHCRRQRSAPTKALDDPDSGRASPPSGPWARRATIVVPRLRPLFGHRTPASENGGVCARRFARNAQILTLRRHCTIPPPTAMEYRRRARLQHGATRACLCWARCWIALPRADRQRDVRQDDETRLPTS